jgi:hypothetical protein
MEDFIVEYRSAVKLRYRTLWIISLVFLVLLLTVHISSYFFLIPVLFIIPFFIPTILLFGSGIYDYNLKNKRLGIKKAFMMSKPIMKLHIRPLIVVLLFIIVIYFFICFFSHMVFRGAPVIIDGRYAISDHGAYTYIGYEQYVKASEAEARVFSAIFIVFTYLSFAYFFSRKKRRE